MKTLTAKDIAHLVKGELKGEPYVEVSGVSSLQDADLQTVSFLGNDKYRNLVFKSDAAVVLLPEDFNGEPVEGKAWVMVEEPNTAFSQVVMAFAPEPPSFPPGIDAAATVSEHARLADGVSVGPQAVIEPGAQIGPNTVIHAGAYIGHEAELGADCIIYQNVSVRERCRIGDRVIIHCNAVIGSDGFGYEVDLAGHRKVPQVGIVQIDDDVEIGACTTIDRARFGRTWIQKHVKIDNQCQIAHNVIIGEGSFLMAQVGIAGSTTLGKFVAMFGQSGLPGHVHIGDFAKIMGGSAPIKDVESNTEILGFPGMERKAFLRQLVSQRKTPELIKQLKALQKRVGDLEARLDEEK